MLRVSRKLIMFKAKSIYDEKCDDNEELKAGFVTSNGWIMIFTEKPFYAKTNNNSAKGLTLPTLRLLLLLFIYL